MFAYWLKIFSTVSQKSKNPQILDQIFTSQSGHFGFNSSVVPLILHEGQQHTKWVIDALIQDITTQIT